MSVTTAPVPAEPVAPARQALAIQVIGIGGAGLQAVAQMQQAGFPDLAFAVVHTDARRLGQSLVPEQRLLGSTLTRGLGAGGDPDLARAAAETDAPALRQLVAGKDLVILVAGLGGGTGSGASPVLARLGREAGALVLALVALPFAFEGHRRQSQAQAALRQLKTACDAVICLPNQTVARLLDENTPLLEAFQISNAMLTDGLRGLWRLISQDGLVTVDFTDLCRVVRGRQADSRFATAEASGDSRARIVLEKLQQHPLLDDGRMLAEADSVLVSLVGGPNLTLKEVSGLMDQLHRACEHAHVIVGAAVNPDLGDRLAVTLVASRRNPVEPADSEPGPACQREFAPPTAEFPIAPDTASPSPDTGASPTTRSASRFVPPPPELSPEQKEQLLALQTGGGRRRRKPAASRQQMLPLEVVSKGRFAKSEPTIREGEDLDTPTYVRRGIPLN